MSTTLPDFYNTTKVEKTETLIEEFENNETNRRYKIETVVARIIIILFGAANLAAAYYLNNQRLIASTSEPDIITCFASTGLISTVGVLAIYAAYKAVPKQLERRK